MTPKKSTDATLIEALRILERDTESVDGVANSCMAEAADRLKELTNKPQPEFQLSRFNPRRNLRGEPAAEMLVDGVRRWMTRKDIRESIRRFGEHKELWKAMEAYDSGEAYSLT